jgi:hypothetical protein
MMRLNQRRFQLANDLRNCFRYVLAMVKDNINLTVEITISNKVVVSWVTQGESLEGEAGAEVGEEVIPGSIIGVDIGITADKMWSIRVLGADLINMGFKINQSCDEKVFTASSWEIDDSVNRGD